MRRGFLLQMKNVFYSVDTVPPYPADRPLSFTSTEIVSKHHGAAFPKTQRIPTGWELSWVLRPGKAGVPARALRGGLGAVMVGEPRGTCRHVATWESGRECATRSAVINANPSQRPPLPDSSHHLGDHRATPNNPPLPSGRRLCQRHCYSH